MNVRHKLSVVIVNAFKRSSIHKELIFAPQKVLPSLFSFVLWFVLFRCFFLCLRVDVLPSLCSCCFIFFSSVKTGSKTNNVLVKESLVMH